MRSFVLVLLAGCSTPPAQVVEASCPPRTTDCSVPNACVPSECTCVKGGWSCAPDCNGCPQRGLGIEQLLDAPVNDRPQGEIFKRPPLRLAGVQRATARTCGVQGRGDREVIAKVINSHLAEVSSCYERALLRQPGLAGRLVVEWQVDAKGSIGSAKLISSTINSAPVGACLLNTLRTWRFPPNAPSVVRYPFIFQAPEF